MTTVRVSVVSLEEANDGIAELWCGNELMGVTLIQDSQLQLQIDPRPHGRPWLVETASLARALARVARPLDPQHPSLEPDPEEAPV